MPPSVHDIQALAQQGDLTGAAALGAEALRIEASSGGNPPAELLATMAVIFGRLGRTAEAARYLDDAQKRDPENPDYILHAAGMAEAAGDAAGAIGHLRRALNLCVPRAAVGKAFTFPDFRTRGDEFAFLNPAFSLGGEDLILRKMFKDKLRGRQPGFYVDIGAASAVLGSNTYLFYCYGWRGVCIDANPRAAKGFSARPRDVFISCAVTASPQPVFFALHKSSNAGSSMIGHDPGGFGPDFLPAVPIPGRPLSDILKENVPAGQAIDFMTIDVEGAELGVVESNDWAAFAPRIIVLEDHVYAARQNSPTVDFLTQRGYAVVGWAAPNVYLERSA